MKKLKKRLPALLMALIIAVMPVLMAVPASASSDVLAGNDVWFIDGELKVPFYPSVPGYYATCVAAVPNGEVNNLVVYYTSSSVASFIPALNEQLSLTSVAYSCTFNGLSGNWENIKLTSIFWTPVSSINTSVFALGSVGSATYDDVTADLLLFPFGSVSPSVGVLSVFSGVSSFLADAVNSAITMFYTAEGGLSVLGILAVASLGLAVILLLMSLIAGWLKFK